MIYQCVFGFNEHWGFLIFESKNVTFSNICKFWGGAGRPQRHSVASQGRPNRVYRPVPNSSQCFCMRNPDLRRQITVLPIGDRMICRMIGKTREGDGSRGVGGILAESLEVVHPLERKHTIQYVLFNSKIPPFWYDNTFWLKNTILRVLFSYSCDLSWLIVRGRNVLCYCPSQ